MRVSELMTPDPVTVSPRSSIDEAMAAMDEYDVRHLPVVEGGRLVGVISDRDLLDVSGWLPASKRAVLLGVTRPATVDEIVSGPPATIAPDDTIVSAVVEFVSRSIGCLPVVKGGELVGVLSELDVLRAYARAVDSGLLERGLDPPIGECMSPAATTVEPEDSLAEATAVLESLGVHHLPVVRGRRVLGMLSDRDLRRAHGTGRSPQTPLAEVMTREVVTVTPDRRVSFAAEVMAVRKISALPAVEGDALVGILTLTDVLDHCLGSLHEPPGRPERSSPGD